MENDFRPGAGDSNQGKLRRHRLNTTVEMVAIRTVRGGGKIVVSGRCPSVGRDIDRRDGKDITFRFTSTVPVIDTSEGRFLNVQLETRCRSTAPHS